MPHTPTVPISDAILSSSTHPMVTRTRDNTRKPRTYPNHVAFVVSTESEPRSFSEAQTDPHWQEAMQLEIDALKKNDTWSLVPPPPNQKVIGCKWVYKIKRKADGTIER